MNVHGTTELKRGGTFAEVRTRLLPPRSLRAALSLNSSAENNHNQDLLCGQEGPATTSSPEKASLYLGSQNLLLHHLSVTLLFLTHVTSAE